MLSTLDISLRWVFRLKRCSWPPGAILTLGGCNTVVAAATDWTAAATGTHLSCGHAPSDGLPTTSRDSADTAAAAALRNGSSRLVRSSSSSRDATAAAADYVLSPFTVSSCRQIPLHLQVVCFRNMGGNKLPGTWYCCFVPGTRTAVVLRTMNLSTVQQ